MKVTLNASLLMLAREVRRKTVQLLDAAHPQELTWAPEGTANHLLWHAGHAVWLHDVLCLRLLSGRSTLPEGWEELFAMGSQPDRPQRPWPARTVLRRELVEQLPRLLAAVEPLTPAQLDAPPPHAYRGDDRTLRECIVHGWHDEANHQGEMYLLLKMQRPESGRT
jgi:hypothetical protein